MKLTHCIRVLFVALTLSHWAAVPSSAVLAQESLRDLDSHAPFVPPSTLTAWQARAADLKLQLQVATGLYPIPELDPVRPQIYGQVECDGYTIEKCIFESLPGFYVTGNLYRPANIVVGKQIPAVLCPHGHWSDARFYNASPAEIRKLISIGAERFEAAAQNHIQARCVQLARMGCIVYHWDMIGYCDSTQISFARAHQFAKQPAESEVADDGWLLFSPLAESHVQSIVGLQSLAIHRAVDMLLTLPEVDPNRIGITGASGGGTQSFLGAALDERIQVAFPAVMVSTGMQGGCTCENCCLLRTGTGNVEMAALIAPRPLGLTAANDWTRTMPEDGFPELKQIYKLFGAESKVALFPAIHFEHNFNHVARTAMYGWMSDHFGLGFEKSVLETDFTVTGRDQLSVWDADHPQPPGGEAFERQLMKLWSEIVDAQLTGLLKGDKQQNEELHAILRNGWKATLGLTTHIAVPTVELTASTDSSSGVVIQVGAEGEPMLLPLALAEQPLVANPRLSAAYTYAYNLPQFAKQAQQLGASLSQLAAQNPGATLEVHGAGPAAALAIAGAFCTEHFAREAGRELPKLALTLDPQDFRFAKVKSIRDPQFLPGAARFWDLPGLAASVEASIGYAAEVPAAAHLQLGK